MPLPGIAAIDGLNARHHAIGKEHDRIVADRYIVTRIAPDLVGAEAADQQVVAVATVQLVVACDTRPPELPGIDTLIEPRRTVEPLSPLVGIDVRTGS